MTHYIELGGQQRPVRFGMAGLYEYEQRTGRKALADFAQLSGQGIENVSISLIVELAFAGLCAGYRSEKMPIDFDAYDVADWVGLDSETIGRVMNAFTESFPHTEQGKQNGAPKAAKAAPSRIGRN